MHSRTVDLDGPLHFADFGGSGVPVVLVHGLGGSHLNWLAVAPALARGARVLAPDLAGFGRTPLAGRSAAVGANRALLGRFLDATVGEPAVLVGNSMGGLIAMTEASLRPDKVAGLVLVGPAQPPPSLAWPDWRVAATFLTYGVPLVGESFMRWRAALLGPEALVRQTLALCCVDPSRVPPEVVAAHVALAGERLEGMPWATEAFLAAARSVLRTLARRAAFEEMVRAIRVPTLVIQGARDRLVPLATTRTLHALRPDWSLEVCEDIGHTPQLEDAERCVAILTEWLALPRPAVLGGATVPG